MFDLGVESFMAQFGIYAGTYLYCFLSGVIPVVNAEIFLILAASMVSKPLLLPVLLLGTLGQMTAKVIIFLTGKGLFKLSYKRYEHKIKATQEKLKKWENKLDLFVFVSALTGFPPFYVTTIVLGTINYNFFRFFIVGFAGRFLRFGILMLFPQLFR